MSSLRSRFVRFASSTACFAIVAAMAVSLSTTAHAQRKGDSDGGAGGRGDDGGLAGVVGAPTGACCMGPNGACVTVTHLECDALAGFYMGDDTDCSLCQNTGRCCIYPNGLPSCEVETLWDCSQYPDWAYWQPGGNCDTACEPRGACCAPGFCYVTIEFICDFYPDRVYLGDDTTCDDCSNLGACCTGLGCTQTLEADCFGTFMGAGTPCDPCGPPTLGMCCFGFECVISDQNDCVNQGGIYFGAGVPCNDDYFCGESPEAGACCIEGECTYTTEAICLIYGGTFEGIGVECFESSCADVTVGMCCIDVAKEGEICVQLTRAECEAQFGVYFGDEVLCDTDYFCGDFPEAGACCLGDGSCMYTTELICSGHDGTFYGIGSECFEFNCTDLPGACCYNNGESCGEMLEGECDALGGTFAGINTFCDNNTCPGWLGTCCLQDANGNSYCMTSTIDDCFLTLGAVYWSVPGVCEDSLPPGQAHCPPFGACCLPNGSCQVVDSASYCTNDLGGVFKGFNTTCADIDGNGKAERCEKPGDTNNDGIVNVTDLLAVISAWGPCPPPCTADVAPVPNGDGVVNVTDLLTVISNWG